MTHSQKKKPITSRQPASTGRKPSRQCITPKDLEGFGEKIQQQFEWPSPPRTFQYQGIEAQLFQKDVLIHAGTGSGKTAVAAGPHVHEKSRGKVTFMVSPLIALQEEQVETFKNEFKLSAIAVNSGHGGCVPEVMAKICQGTWQIVILSPEMLLSKKFVSRVLRNPEITNRILSIVVDEAHVISHWGSGFRKKYGSLGVLRALLPKGTPIVAMSATLPPRVRRDVLNKLQFGNDYININLGNDRPNVSIVVRAIQNNMNTYSDLDFLIPSSISEATHIPKTFVYADNVSAGVEIEDRLYNCCSESIRNLGIIRPYSAAYSAEYRARVMQLFKDGSVRILICTDAAGMGCNIPDIDIVVQWKLPASVSSFVQRAGRAARAKNHVGLAVLLVEKSTYEADLSKINQSPPDEPGAKTLTGKGAARPGVHQPGTYPKATKGYAVRHGAKRGAFGGQDDGTPNNAIDVAIDIEAPDEGLYSLVQTGRCCRLTLMVIFGNEMPGKEINGTHGMQRKLTLTKVPTVPCCDICDPSLLNRTRPGKVQHVERIARLSKRGQHNETVKSVLHEWRTLVVERDFPNALFGASSLLKDETMELLSSIGPIASLEYLEQVLAGHWTWFPTYGSELYSQLQGLTIPPPQALVPKNRGAKRGPGVNGVEAGQVTRKRMRVTTEAPALESSTAHRPPTAQNLLRQNQLNQVPSNSAPTLTTLAMAPSSPEVVAPYLTPTYYQAPTSRAYNYGYYHTNPYLPYLAYPSYHSEQPTLMSYPLPPRYQPLTPNIPSHMPLN